MKQTRRIVLALLAAAIGLLPAGFPAHAASPKSGKLVPGSTVTWSGGPLNGAAQGRHNELCNDGVNCDDFMLDIEIPRTFAKPLVHLKLTFDDPNDMRILLYPPGATSAPGSSLLINYQGYSDEAKLNSPKNGEWRIRISCNECVNATYTVTAKVEVPPFPTEPKGIFDWRTVTLPGDAEGEPNIWASGDRRLYVNAPASGDNGAGVAWRSDDDGKTWKRIDGVDSVQPQLTGDTDLAVAPDDGTVYFANLSYDAFTNWVYASNDHGDTWTGPAPAGTDSDRQWLAAGPNGVVYMAYHDSSQMWIWRSDDHGKTFLKASDFNLASDSWSKTMCGNHMTRPLIDPHDPNLIYLLYSTSDLAGCAIANPAGEDHYLKEIWVAKSSDGGTTWTQKQIYSSNHTTDHNLSAATMDRAGNIYMAFAEAGAVERLKGFESGSFVDGAPEADAEVAAESEKEGDLSTHVRLLVSTDKGETWSKPLLVDGLRDHHSNVFATIAAGDAGHVALAWYTSKASSFDDGDAKWSVAFASTSDATAPAPHFVQSRVSPAYVHEGSICQSGLACTVSGYDRNLLDFMGIAITPDGMANVIYNNDTSGAVLAEFGRQIAGPSAKTSPTTVKPKPVVQGRHDRRPLPATGVGSDFGFAALMFALALLGRRFLRAPR
ncbi:MAG: sialidase family protein [Actinomycetota bacterium]|nr:glycoside hydrolase [Actinomycetota bacterium]